MNEFVLYQQLCGLAAIADRYPQGKACAARLNQTAERIASQLYRVAVIGEFKRGKSSLVNAIIGADVLPTDILPMTAAITRITYGEKRRILIRYKDGREEERSVEELLEFATKADAQKEKRAETIREIEVCYPSVFCKNHIDILDTPGLNDNAAMTAVTLSVLGDVDAAIMVVSAREPLSMTEQELILKLIAEKGIRHIVFVVTHIDAVSSRKSQQDRIIQYIRERLAGLVLSSAKDRFAEDPVLLEKAERILSQPDIFGVSSVLAMEGFLQDNLDLLDESRFPVFKQELFALLTAAQSADVRLKTLDAAAEVEKGLLQWKTAADAEIQAEIQRLEVCRDVRDACRESGIPAMDDWLLQMDRELAAQGLIMADSDNSIFEKELCPIFISSLSAITEETNTEEAVCEAIASAEAKATERMAKISESLLERMHAKMAAIENRLEKICCLGQLTVEQPAQTMLPQSPLAFCWQEPVMPEGALLNRDVMPLISQKVHTSIFGWIGGLMRHISSWRKQMRYRMIGCAETADSAPTCKALMDLEEQRHLVNLQYRLDTEQLADILSNLPVKQ